MDVFLSYNRRDKTLADGLDALLRDKGLKVFLDTRELVAGQDWVPVLEEAIGRAATALVVLIGPHGLGRWQHKEYSLGLQRQEREPAFPVIPVLLPGTRAEHWPTGFLALPTWVSFAEAGTLDDRDALGRLLLAIGGGGEDAASLRASICPYKGLFAFQEEDQGIFFGRGADAAALQAKLLDRQAVCLIGRSGTGKSSLIRAGLMAQLRRRSTAQGAMAWDSLEVRPGTEPLQALAAALDPPAEHLSPSARLDHVRTVAGRLRDNGGDFAAQLMQDLARQRERRIERFLILLDQAEEAFTPPPNRTREEETAWHRDAEHALLLLREMVRLGPASLVATIRTDYYDALHVSPLADLTLDDRLVQTRGIRDLRAAIVGPANLVGLRFADKLVERILRETGEESDNLPLLQHALERSWAHREKNVITFAAYETSGGVDGAINQTAQLAYDGLGAAQKAAAKRVFLRLVRPGEGRDHLRVRAALPQAPAERDVADYFGKPERRLIFFGEEAGQPRMEVAHEALVRGWPELLAWVKNNAEQLAARDAVRDWQRLGVGDVLPPGALLGRARELLADPGDVALDEIAPLIEASLAAEKRAAKVAQRARRLRLAAFAGALVFLVGGGAGLWVREVEMALAGEVASATASIAEEQRRRAEEQAQLEAARAAYERALRREAETAQRDAEHQRQLAQEQQRQAESEAARAEREAEAAAAARHRAEAAFGAARGAAEALVVDLAQGLQDRTGMPSDLVAQILDRAGQALDELTRQVPGDAQSLRLQLAFQGNASTNFLRRGDVSRALIAGRAALAIAERLVAADPDNAERRSDLSVSYGRIGDVLVAQGHLAGALTAFRAGMATAERLVAADPGNAQWQRDLAVSYNRIGDVLVAQGDREGALDAFHAGMAIAERLAAADPGNAQWQRELSVSHDRIGNVLVAQGHLAGALAAFRAGMAIAERLAAADPGNAPWQRDLSISHNRIGEVLVAQGDREGALDAFHAGMAIAERLAAADPGNAEWQRDLSISHNRIGEVLVAQGDREGALDAFHAGMAIAERLAAADPGNAEWQRDLSISHNRIGEVLVAQGDREGALAAFRASMAIRARLAGADPGNAQWQRDLSISHERIGDVLVAQGDLEGGLAAFRSSSAIAERLAAADPGNSQWQRDLFISHWKLAQLAAARGDAEARRAQLRAARDQATRMVARFPQIDEFPRMRVVAEDALRRLDQPEPPP